MFFYTIILYTFKSFCRLAFLKIMLHYWLFIYFIFFLANDIYYSFDIFFSFFDWSQMPESATIDSLLWIIFYLLQGIWQYFLHVGRPLHQGTMVILLVSIGMCAKAFTTLYLSVGRVPVIYQEWERWEISDELPQSHSHCLPHSSGCHHGQLSLLHWFLIHLFKV